MPKKKFDIFYILDAISNTKEDVTEHPEFEKTYNIFMINRWLSMHPHTIWGAYFADQIQGMDKKQHFYFVRELIEKKKIYIRYKKGSQKEKNLKIVMNYYEVGETEAREIVNILNSSQIKLLDKAFGGRAGKR